jgi:CheY-like chemotaxis protein
MDKETLKGKIILIVDDDFPSRLYLNRVLEKEGGILINAINGQEAVDIAKINPDIDIILMDLQLPVMDGYTATRIIRGFREDVIIIAQTAYGLSTEMERICEFGFNDYLMKPILHETLVERLISSLQKYYI